MNLFLKLISYAGLVLTAIPGALVFAGLLRFEQYTTWMLIGSVLWFATAPFWVGKEKNKNSPL